MATKLEQSPVEEVKEKFDPIKFLRSKLHLLPGTEMIIRPVTGTAYRVNWYCKDTNTIRQTVWVQVIEENGAAELHYPEHQ